MNLSIRCHVWYLLVNLLVLLVRADKIQTDESQGNGLVHSCIGLKQSQIQICTQIEVEDDFIKNDTSCNVEDCRASCCSCIKNCFKTNYFTNNRIDCVSKKLEDEYGSCCKVKTKKYSKTKVLYMAGGLGIAVASTGLYILSFSKSKGEEIYESSDDEDDPLINIQDTTPHLDVNKIMATDENDVFWNET